MTGFKYVSIFLPVKPQKHAVGSNRQQIGQLGLFLGMIIRKDVQTVSVLRMNMDSQITFSVCAGVLHLC